MSRKSVVHQMLCRAVVAVGCTGYQDNREILSIGSPDRVDGGKPANAESDHGSCRSTRTRIALGTVAAVQLIAAIDLLQFLDDQQLIEQHKIEVAGDREMVLQSDLLKAPGEIAADCVGHCILSWCRCTRTASIVLGSFPRLFRAAS